MGKSRIISGDGRWMIPVPDGYEGKTYINGYYVYEHRYIMEQKLGRLLSYNEIVHHKDGDKLNNHPDNLRLKTRKDHSIEHGKDRKIHMVRLKCPCGKRFNRDRRQTHLVKKNSRITCCSRSCSARLSSYSRKGISIDSLIERNVLLFYLK